METIDRKLVREHLYKKYIEPTKKKRTAYIGVEIEMPVINLDKKPVDFDVVHKVTADFIRHFDFEISGRDDEGDIYAVSSPKNGDILSYDCSYNNLELSFGRENNLFSIESRLHSYYTFLKEEFETYRHTLTGMGVNPYRKYNRNVPIPNGRYRMLFHHLNTYDRYDLPMYFHKYPEYGTFSSASQVQLDVSYEDLPTALNAFSKLEPIKALLFSNSVLLDEREELLCCRDMFWENSTHGINPHNIGMFDCEFSDIDDIMAYIESTSIYCVEREEKYINFPPIPIMDYFRQPEIQGEYYDGSSYQSIRFQPELQDIDYLRTFKFEDLTFRGTIEFRSACCQPICDSLTVAAFHVGLMNRLHRLDELLSQDHTLYHRGYTPSELRKLFVKRKCPGFVNQSECSLLVRKILDLCSDGLKERGYGEDILLQPLYERLSAGMNPAQKMLDMRRRGIDLEEIILEYGKMD